MSASKQVPLLNYKTPSTYVYSPSGIDTQLWNAVLVGRERTSQQTYRPNQVESLLNSAADLLDRCLRNKREVEELLAREASLAFDLRLEAIRQNLQVDSTAYQSALLRASEKVDTRNRTSTFNSDIDTNGKADQYLRPPLQLINSQITAWEWLLKEHETKSEKHQGTASLNAAIFSAIQHVISRDSQSEQLAAIRDAIDRSNLRMAETADLLALREEARQNGNVHDFKAKASAIISTQLVPDLLDASDRCEAAANGLRALYGWNGDVQIAKPNIRTTDFLPAFVEKLSAWNSSAIRYLLSFGHFDQECTHFVNVQDALPNEWIVFDVRSDELLDKFRNIRFRGISAFIEDASGAQGHVYSVEVKLPDTGRIVHSDHAATASLHQDLPPITIGTVTSAGSARISEVAGEVSHRNASPIPSDGNSWKLRYKLITPTDGTVARSVRLQLFLTGRPTW